MFCNEPFPKSNSVTADTLEQRLIHLTHLLARLAAQETLAETTADQSTNRLTKFRSENVDG